jgi:hypothetical protein
VDPRETATRLTDRGAVDQCPACGGFLTLLDDAYLVLSREAVLTGGLEGLEVAALVCTNCGCIRLHATAALEAPGD